MTTAVQHRRGTTAEHAAFTGLEGELTIDTTKDTAVIHDGTLAGGYPLAKENLANVTTSGLSSIDGASTASDDKFFIYDQSATSLKTITRAELNNAIEQDALANVAITGGTINGTTIGGTTAAGGSFTTLSASSTATLNTLASSGATLTGGTINGMAIGGTTAAAVSATTLTTSGAVTHNGGTANGVAYLNGSKVLTTGSALTFDGTTLTSSNATGANVIFNSTANTPYVSFAESGASKFIIGASAVVGGGAGYDFYGATGIGLTFFTNAARRLDITSAGDVGIGTSSPGTKLDVRGSVTSQADTAYYRIRRASAADVGYVTDSGTWGDSGADFAIGASSSNLRFYTNNIGAERMRLDSSGNLGLGVTPSAWNQSVFKALQINGQGALMATSASMQMGNNVFYDGLYKFIGTGYANRYYQASGQHVWTVSTASGSAGGTITETQAMTLDASGNLLIGQTTNPNSYRAVLNTLGSNNVLSMTNNVNASMDVYLTSGVSTINAQTGTLALATSGTERARITSGGDFGIGTNTPAGNLNVNTTGNTQVTISAGNTGLSRLVFQGQVSNNRGFIDYDNTSSVRSFIFRTNEAEAMRIDSSGNLGLGIAPSAWNTIKPIEIARAGSFVGANSSGSTYLGANTRYASGWIYANTGAAGLYTVEDNTHFWRSAPSGTAGDPITFTQAMTLTAAGDLLVGTTTVAPGAVNSTLGASLGNASSGGSGGYVSASRDQNIAMYLNRNTSDGEIALFCRSGTQVGSISVTTTATAYNTSSDYRLKTVIGPVANAGQRIDALEPVEYEWKTDGSRTRGFLAHQFQEVYAGSVSGTKDAVDDEGKPVYQSMQASTSEVIADLVAEIQSLRQRLAAAGI